MTLCSFISRVSAIWSAAWAAALIVASLAVFPAVAAEQQKPRISLTAEEQMYLRAHPTIRIHNETDWPPFNFFQNGKPQGFSIEYMNLLASIIGVKVKYVTGPTWNEFLDLMKRDELDVMLNIVKTPEREKYLLYTKPYTLNPNSILSRREVPYDNLEQLFGKTVSLPKGFFYEEILKRDFPKIKLHLVKNVQESMKAVIFGKADAALGEQAVFNHLMEQEMMTGLTLSGEVKLGSPNYSRLNIATRKNQPLLVSILRKAMEEVNPEQVKALRQRWVGSSKASLSTPKLVLSEKEEKWLADHKTMRFGVDPGYPPFEFIDDNGVVSGMSSDYIRLISERLGITMEVIPNLSWVEVLGGIKARTVDFTPSVAKAPDRLANMNFSRPYMAFPVVIVSRDDYPLVGGLNDLSGANAALVMEFAVTNNIKANYPGIIGNMVASPLQALQSVALGKNDVAVMNLAVATYLIKKHGLANLKVAAPAEIDLPGLSFAVRKDWPELIGILDKALASITPEEESAIRSKWAQVSYQTGIETEQVLKAAGVAVIILIVIVVWNRRLQQEVKQRKLAESQMGAAKNEAERLTQAKSDFIAVISHEIRTPMNGVLGMARLLTETRLDDEQKECVDTVVESGEALLTIMDDLLDLSKLDAGRLEIENRPFIPQDMIEHSVNLLKQRADEKGLPLECLIDPNFPEILVGDALRIRQIILNLLSNAIKFTDEGVVTMAARLEGQSGGTANVSFTVADTGRGIPPESLKKLFSDYDQGSVEVARKYGGTGLGLAICRRMANLMGGRITVDSTVNVGSAFKFQADFAIDSTTDVDILRQQAMTERTTSEIKQTAHPLRVLQVEDNATNRTVIERVLSRAGHTVISVEHGELAIEALQSDNFDVVLMDRHMPVMDGIDATRLIRGMEGEVASIPIIGITAAASQSEVDACINAGMDRCLTKPVEAVKLRSLLEIIGSGGVLNAPNQPDTAVEADDPVEPDDGAAPIDLGQLSRILGEEDEDELFMMLGIFNAEFPKLLADLEGAITECDIRAIHDSAHAAKGAAANAGAASLSAMLKEIEIDAHLENWQRTEERCEAAKLEYARVLQFCNDRG